MIEPGTRIGSYCATARLGAGGMGEVYQARDLKLERDVALKVMRTALPADVDLTSRFVREAKTLAALNHPNIAQIYGFEDWNGLLVIVMELVTGETLADRIRAGPLAVGEAMAIARQIADAMVYAHETGVVHRDLKPGNVKLRPDGLAKVLDFGLAKSVGVQEPHGAGLDLTVTGMVLGTPAYMAPELLRGAPADERSDVFAFGVLLFELLTSRHPFYQPSDRGHVSEAILNPRPVRWPQGGPHVPATLQFIVGKAIEKDRRVRYQAMRELRSDLLLFSRDREPIDEVNRLDRAEIATVIPDRVHGGVASTRQMPVDSVPTARRWMRLAIGGALAIAFVSWAAFEVWRVLGRDAATAAIGATHTQVTYLGNVRGAAFSPDGRTLAYVTREDKAWQLTVRDVVGGNPLPIFSAEIITELQWVPNGSELVVSGSKAGQLGVWIVPRLGGTARQLGEAGARIAVAPDGSTIALAFRNDRAVRLVSTSGGPSRSIPVNGVDWIEGLDWGAATNRLAILTSGGQFGSSVWVVSPAGGDLRRIYSDAALLASPRWSPFGNALYVIRTNQEFGDVIRLTPGEAELEEPEVLLTGLPWDPTDPYQRQSSLSTDGRRLLYVRGVSSANLWRLPTTGRGAAEQITPGTLRFGRPSFSPDGQWIVSAVGTTSRASIVKLPFNGGEPVRLTHGDTADGTPAWSPDGRQIAFARVRGGVSSIWLIDPDGKHLTELPASRSAIDPAITWTPTGDLMWLLPAEDDFVRRRPGGGSDTRLTKGPPSGVPPGQLSEARVSPAGDQTAVWWNRSRESDLPDGLWLVSASGDERLLLAGPYYPAGWSPNGQWVYALELLGRGIVRVATGGGKPELIGTFPTGSFGRCAVSPDGHYIVCNLIQTQSDAFLVDNFDSKAPGPTR